MKKAFTAMLLLLSMKIIAQQTVRYDLFVSDTLVNYTGKKVHAIAINGTIPAPTLYFTEGDTALIYVHNTMKEETSIHWHGLVLPNDQDGVPYLTTAPIKPNSIHIYKFAIKQNGTYWYHSHTKLQEQSGLYGAFIIYKKNEIKMPEYTLLLSDWTNAKPAEVHRSLHNANDWYAIKKGSTQSYSEALAQGYFFQRLKSDWLRMTPMDVSDVYYDKFLVNGKPETQATQFKAGEKVRLRIINGSSSSYFWLQYAGGKIAVVANDGKDVVPVYVDRMIVAVAETYDIIVTIPSDSICYEFQATPEDRTNQVSIWLGSGAKKLAPPMPQLKYFEGLKMMNGMMNMDGSMDAMGMQMSNQQMDMNTVMYPEITGEKQKGKMKMDNMPGMQHDSVVRTPDIVTLNYGMLRSPVKTNLPDSPTMVLHFKLTGNMQRYLWTIDNKTVSETDKIMIKQGENVRIIIENASMMRHPMHLHGHFFRLLNGQGDYAPLKNVVDIMPMEIDTIEFAGTESGDWFFHCHILYHMMSGMGKIFSYENSPPNPEIPDPKKAIRKLYQDDRAWHPMAHICLESNGSDGDFMVSNKRNTLSTEWRIGTNQMMGYESESHFGRFIGHNQFLRVYFGWDFRYRVNDMNAMSHEKNLFGITNTKNKRQAACVGFQYMLPFFVLADFRMDQTGNLRIQISRDDIPISKRLRLSAMANTDYEYMVRARFIMTKYFSLSAHYDSDMGFGGGLMITY